jgi:hypothetical protein
MKAPSVRPVRCAIHTRVSTEHGLDQEFNSLDAQYDAASAYIKSQAHAGWTLIRSRYDDGPLTYSRQHIVSTWRASDAEENSRSLLGSFQRHTHRIPSLQTP